MIDEALGEMQQNPSEGYLWLMKLEVGFGEGKEAIVEWAVGQLVQERGRVVKELVKMMMTG